MEKLKEPVVAALLLLALSSVPAVPAEAAGRLGNVPATGAAASQFNPLSVTFVSLSEGWALGAVPCRRSGACLVLEQTNDAGKSWSIRPLPLALLAETDRRAYGGQPVLLDIGTLPVVDVRFANPSDGWIYGDVPTGTGTEALLWSTHDGGRTWRQVHPFATADVEFPYYDLEAMGGFVYLMGASTKFGVTVESTPASFDDWRRDMAPRLELPAGGAEPSGSFVFQDGSGWLVEGNDRGITGSARLESRGAWAAWPPPCGAVGDSYTVPAAASPLYMVAVCVMGGFASTLSKGAPPGATIGSTWLYVSQNGGASFHAGPLLAEAGGPCYCGVLASPAPGAVLSGRSSGDGRGQLAASFDGGYHWSAVYTGDFFYLGFTSPTQGVGLYRRPAAGGGATTAMVMSFNGGHSWSRVRFAPL